MYYTVIKHDRHLRTRGKCRKHEPQASIFYISRVFSNVRSRLRPLHLLYDIDVMWQKIIQHAFSMFYTLIKDGFLTNERAQGPIYIIICNDFMLLLLLKFIVSKCITPEFVWRGIKPVSILWNINLIPKFHKTNKREKKICLILM